MLYFISLDQNKFPIEVYLNLVKKSLGFKAVVISYNKVNKVKSFKDSIVIFCDIERFTDNSIDLAKMIFYRAQLEGARLILNNPEKVVRRYDLLKLLYREGINLFDAYRLPLDERSLHYPVFYRNELDHNGPRSELLYSGEEVKLAISETMPGAYPDFQPLLVEYIDISDDDNRYHKYGCFYLNGRIIPRHLFFSTDWIVKTITNDKEDDLAREIDYVKSSLFSDDLIKIFNMANVQYGRIDFAKSEAGIQIFEINTNPTIIKKTDLISNRKKPTEIFLKNFTTSLQNLYEHGI
jgi:hypothetical protein